MEMIKLKRLLAVMAVVLLAELLASQLKAAYDMPQPACGDMHTRVAQLCAALQAEPSPEGSGTLDAEETTPLPGLYQGFLDGLEPATVAGWFSPEPAGARLACLEQGMAYSLSELQALLCADSSLEYCLFDAGSDGEPELSVCLPYYGPEPPPDGGAVTLLFKETDGTLLLCDAFETWDRSDTTLHYDGFLETWGASGAGDHLYRTALLDSKCRRLSFYQCETVSGEWMALVDEQAIEHYNELFAHEYPETMWIAIYTVGAETFYTYEMEGMEDIREPAARASELEMADALTACFTAQGVAFLTSGEAAERIKVRAQELGISH